MSEYRSQCLTQRSGRLLSLSILMTLRKGQHRTPGVILGADPGNVHCPVTFTGGTAVPQGHVTPGCRLPLTFQMPRCFCLANSRTPLTSVTVSFGLNQRQGIFLVLTSAVMVPWLRQLLLPSTTCLGQLVSRFGRILSWSLVLS